MDLEKAAEAARELAEHLRPACRQLSIAGSIRRAKPWVKDIEIAAQAILRPEGQPILLPTFLQPDTTGHSLLNERCADLLRTEVLAKRQDSRGRTSWGPRLKRALFHWRGQAIPADIFSCDTVEEWGALFAIRTGPADFNRLLVTPRRFGGACPKDRKVAGLRVWDLGKIGPKYCALYDFQVMTSFRFLKLAREQKFPTLRTCTEEQFFRALQVPFWLPGERTLGMLRKYLKERNNG